MYKKYKKFFSIGLIVVLLNRLNTYATYIPEVASNEFAMYKEHIGELNQIHTLEVQDQKVGESESLILYLNKKDLSIKVLQKSTGYIYSSNDVDTKNLNGLWQNYVNSPVTIKYIDESFKIVQESIGDHKDSTQKVRLTDNGFEVDLYFGKGQIALTYGVELKDNELLMSIDNDSIKEEASSKILKEKRKQESTQKQSDEKKLSVKEKLMGKEKKQDSSYDLYAITLYPFFGALEAGQQDGYTFIPDGSGALIRYDKHYKGINIPFEQPLVDNDYGIPMMTGKNNYHTNYASQINFSVYGMIHGINQSGFINIIEEGDEHGKLLSYPPGVTTDFYFTTIEYIYNNIYQSKISETNKITSKLEERHPIDIKEKFIFVDQQDANYVGLANRYKTYLMEQGALNTFKIEEIPLSLNITTGMLKKGLLFNRMETLTTTDDIVEMEKRLKEQGINTLYFNIFADKTELTGKTQDSSKLNAQVEGKYSFKELNQYLKENNDIAFLATPLTAFYGDGKLDEEVIRTANKEYAQFKGKIGNKTYVYSLLTTEGVQKNLKYILEKMENNGFQAYYSTDQVTPSSNFGKNNSKTRQESKESLVDAREQLTKNATILGSNRARDFELKQTDVNFNTPMSTTIYQFITDTVPFYQIVLSGNIPMVSEDFNNESDLEEMILKCIEYNVYPSFGVMYSSYDKLEKGLSTNLYSHHVEYDKWEGKIVNAYKEIESKLGQVKNEMIMKHEMIAPRIAAITYSNGKTIVVNYTDQDFMYKNTIVKGKESVVLDDQSK